MGRNQNTNTNRNFGSLLQPSWMAYGGSNTSVKEVTADVVERVRKVELELEPEHETELLQIS